jgi:hypothetical protein
MTLATQMYYWNLLMKSRTPKQPALSASLEFQKPLTPRQWAADICAAQGIEQRRKMLESVPDEWRALVRKHVENFFARRKHA